MHGRVVVPCVWGPPWCCSGSTVLCWYFGRIKKKKKEKSFFWLSPTINQSTPIQPEKIKAILKFKDLSQECSKMNPIGSGCQWSSWRRYALSVQMSSKQFIGCPKGGSCRTCHGERAETVGKQGLGLRLEQSLRRRRKGLWHILQSCKEKTDLQADHFLFQKKKKNDARKFL